jgi:hypothetical protein
MAGAEAAPGLVRPSGVAVHGRVMPGGRPLLLAVYTYPCSGTHDVNHQLAVQTFARPRDLVRTGCAADTAVLDMAKAPRGLPVRIYPRPSGGGGGGASPLWPHRDVLIAVCGDGSPLVLVTLPLHGMVAVARPRARGAAWCQPDGRLSPWCLWPSAQFLRTQGCVRGLQAAADDTAHLAFGVLQACDAAGHCSPTVAWYDRPPDAGTPFGPPLKRVAVIDTGPAPGGPRNCCSLPQLPCAVFCDGHGRLNVVCSRAVRLKASVSCMRVAWVSSLTRK